MKVSLIQRGPLADPNPSVIPKLVTNTFWFLVSGQEPSALSLDSNVENQRCVVRNAEHSTTRPIDSRPRKDKLKETNRAEDTKLRKG